MAKQTAPETGEKLIKLSPTQLSLFNNCPRCYWNDKIKGLKRPTGPFPTILNAMDQKIKNYFDYYRKTGDMPPNVKLKGNLFKDIALLKSWRNWQSTPLKYKDPILNIELSGALDDCLTYKQYYMPLDFKLTGYIPKYDYEKYYKTQLSSYGLMLDAKGYSTCGEGFLLYVIPDEMDFSGITYITQAYTIKIDINSVKHDMKCAAMVLRNEVPPEPPETCIYCKYHRARNEINV